MPAVMFELGQYSPAGHGFGLLHDTRAQRELGAFAHVKRRASQMEPLGQKSGADIPASGQKEPSGHADCALAPAGQKVPAAQTVGLLTIVVPQKLCQDAKRGSDRDS